jgi:hypothetical protein
MDTAETQKKDVQPLILTGEETNVFADRERIGYKFFFVNEIYEYLYILFTILFPAF